MVLVFSGWVGREDEHCRGISFYGGGSIFQSGTKERRVFWHRSRKRSGGYVVRRTDLGSTQELLGVGFPTSVFVW